MTDAIKRIRDALDHGDFGPMLADDVEELLAERDALAGEVKRRRQYVARYRWLRGDSCPDHSSRWTQWEVRCWKAPSWTGDLRRADLDDAIDDARGKE